MDIFFQDPDDVPVPPDEVRIREFRAEPYPDARRVRIYLEVSPFQKRPSGEITITDRQGRLAASANIIESMSRKMELTLHLRGAVPAGAMCAAADIFYQDAPAEGDGEGAAVELPERKQVDRMEIEFTLPESRT